MDTDRLCTMVLLCWAYSGLQFVYKTAIEVVTGTSIKCSFQTSYTLLTAPDNTES